MVSRAGIAVFAFGNKQGSSGDVVPADGMLEEFELALEAGLVVVPVGATGYVAQALHDKVSSHLEKYYPKAQGLKTALAALKKEGTPSEVVERVLKFVRVATKHAETGESVRRR
jgi:hypothetical protein